MITNHNELLHYCVRIKSKRQKKRIRIKSFQKQLLKTYQEQQFIYKAMRNMEYIELSPPIKRGFKRYFIVRHDVAIGKDGAFFETLLTKINTVQFSHRRDFKRKKRRKGKKILVERPQAVKELRPYELKKLGITEKEMHFFKEIQERVDNITYKKFVFTEPWRYLLKVSPNFITHLQRINPILEQQAADINNYLTSRHLTHKLFKFKNGSCKNRRFWEKGEKNKYLPFTDPKLVRKAIQQYYHEREAKDG